MQFKKIIGNKWVDCSFDITKKTIILYNDKLIPYAIGLY